MSRSRVDELFERALELDHEARRPLLARTASEDAELVAHVEELLRAVDGPSPLDEPLADVAQDLLDGLEQATARRDALVGSILGSYRIDRLHARGGMADVYCGHRADGSFHRQVAVKVLRRGFSSHDDLKRFDRERQVLAELSNRHVATLHDGGVTDDDRPYLVLEWIDGVPLTEHARSVGLGWRERVGLLLQVCEGVRHAHRRGVLHRDLKPSNLLVDRIEASGRVVVCDFGIAKSEREGDLTLTGHALGTPGYMSPEQAAGERSLGPTADVFALGAVLYELVCDQRLYAGESSSQVYAQALRAEFVAPRSVQPELSRDLETIILCCLDRDPESRYQSVADLAGDLGALLAGEPISARREGWVERTLRTLRRYPRTAFAGALASLAVVVLGVLALQSRWQSAARAEQAQQLGRVVERLDADLRIEHGLPLHDIRPAYQRVRSEMERLRQVLRGRGKADAAIHWAIGRGHQALGELASAREELELAYETLPTERVALSLGSVLAEMYQQELSRARRDRDEEARVARIEELHRELRDPALRLLEEGRGSEGEPGLSAWIDGLIALQEERWDDVERLAQEALEEQASLYEAHALAARARTARGQQLANGGRYDEAVLHYEAAEQRMLQALEIARSDPQMYFRRCALANHVLTLRRETGEWSVELFARTAATCAEGLEADPDHYELAWSVARVYWQEQNFLRGRGLDPLPALERQIAAAQRAVSIRPDQPQALNYLGLGWFARAQLREDLGESIEGDLDQARKAFERTLEVEPTHVHANNNLGLVDYLTALEDEQAGEDPTPAARRAVDSYRRTIELDPEYLFAYNNATVAWQVVARAARRAGEDPAPALEEGIRWARQALEINPNFSNALENLGDLLQERIRLALDRDEDPSEMFNEATVSMERAIEVNDTFWSHHCGLAQVHRLRATWVKARAEDPRPALALARESLERAEALNPRAVELRREWIRWSADNAAVAVGAEKQHALRDGRRRLSALRRDLPELYGLDELAEALERAATAH